MTSQFASFLAPCRQRILSCLALLLALVLNFSLVHPAQAATFPRVAAWGLHDAGQSGVLAGVDNGGAGLPGATEKVADGQASPQPGGQFFLPSIGQNGGLAGAAYGYPNAGLMVLILVLVVVGGGIALRVSHRRPQITPPPHPTLAEAQPFAIADYRAYLVRLWRENPQAPWRASAQCARTGEKSYFSTLADLYAFLETQTAAPSTAPPAAGVAANQDQKSQLTVPIGP